MLPPREEGVPMPWQERTVMSERQEFIAFARQEGATIAAVCRQFGISRKTFYIWYHRWIAAGKHLSGLYEKSRRPHSHPNTTPPHVAEKIIALRKQTHYGPLRLSFHLVRDHHLQVSPFRIYRVLGRAGLLTRRERRRRRKPRQYIVLQPGQKVQVDVKYLDVLFDERHPEGIKEYQYTAIDCATRVRFTEIYQEVSPHNSVDFVKKVIAFYPFSVRVIQTDNGTEFTYELMPHVQVEHPLDVYLKSVRIIHKLIPVGRKEYNGRVERSHRTDDEELYRPGKFTNVYERREAAKKFMFYFNNQRPHLALGFLTPMQMLRSLARSQGVTHV
jgi:transposase InsO family protein